MLDIFWELSHDENYLPVCARCCQFPCQATSAVAPVSLTLMIINDTLSLHCAQLQGKETSTVPPHSLCRGHYEKDLVLPWPAREQPTHVRSLLCTTSRAFAFHVTSLPWPFALCLCILSFLRKGTYFPCLWFFHVIHQTTTTINKSRFLYGLTHSTDLCNSEYETMVTNSLTSTAPVSASHVWEIRTFLSSIWYVGLRDSFWGQLERGLDPGFYIF